MQTFLWKISKQLNPIMAVTENADSKRCCLLKPVLQTQKLAFGVKR